MRREILKFLLILATVGVTQAAITEPLVGTWTLSSQTKNGQKVDPEQMTLRIPLLPTTEILLRR